VSTRLYAESAGWRLRALSNAQHAMLSGELPAPEIPQRVEEQDRQLLMELAVDGRRSATDLAAALGTSPAKARRRLNAMIRSGAVQLRCEVAQSYTPWPVKVIYLGSCPPSELDTVGHTLAASPDIRVCVALMGADNVLFSVWISKPASSVALEIGLARSLPQLHIRNRMLALHSVKRMGRLLDDAGRCIGVVPMDMWQVLGHAS